MNAEPLVSGVVRALERAKETTLDEAARPPTKAVTSRSTRRPRARSERALREQVRRLLALPMAKRMNFLRVRVGRGTAL